MVNDSKFIPPIVELIICLSEAFILISLLITSIIYIIKYKERIFFFWLYNLVYLVILISDLVSLSLKIFCSDYSIDGIDSIVLKKTIVALSNTMFFYLIIKRKV